MTTPDAAAPRTLHDLLTSDEVAARLRLDVATVRRMTLRGELPGYRVGRGYRYAPSAVAAYLAGRSTVAAAASTSTSSTRSSRSSR